jgi:hypothetical protein
LAAVVIEGCDADEGCDLFLAGVAELGQLGDEDGGDDGSDAGDGAQQLGTAGEFAIGLDLAGDRLDELGDLLAEEGEMALDRGKAHRVIGMGAVLLFHGQHVVELAPATNEVG